MQIVTISCGSGPMKSKPCLAFFGVEYQTYIILLLLSLVIAAILSFAYIKIKKQNINLKIFVIKGLLTSVVIFILLSIAMIYYNTTFIY